MSEIDTCRECGEFYGVDLGNDDDGLCHPCAHDLAATREETLREIAAKLLWPLNEKDATHAVDDYRRGRWDAYQIVKKMLPPDPPEFVEATKGAKGKVA